MTTGYGEKILSYPFNQSDDQKISKANIRLHSCKRNLIVFNREDSVS